MNLELIYLKKLDTGKQQGVFIGIDMGSKKLTLATLPHNPELETTLRTTDPKKPVKDISNPKVLEKDIDNMMSELGFERYTDDATNG